jgi:hypothetical protein
VTDGCLVLASPSVHAAARAPYGEDPSMPRLSAVSFSIAFLVSVPSPCLSADGRAVAMVMAIDGTTTPQLSPFAELREETVLLDGSSSMTLVHYETCEAVTVRGGQVTATAHTINTTGQILRRVKRPCPKEHLISSKIGSGGKGAMLLRSSLRLGTRPRLVIVGSRATSLASAEIRKATNGSSGSRASSSRLGAINISERLLLWPASLPELQVGESYFIRLYFVDSREPTDINFTASQSITENELVILRIE